MKQRKLILTVKDSNGDVVFQKDPAHPDHVPATLALFGEPGHSITIDVVEFDVASGIDN